MADLSVRTARLLDVDALARIQIASWSATPGLPADVAPPALDDALRAWERAVLSPPSPRHQVWSAMSGDEVVGLAAVAPAPDPDLETATTSELMTLVVAAEHRSHGHGSRLLAAAMESLKDSGVQLAVVWLTTQDDRTRLFLESAGWAADGAFRTLAADDSDADQQQLRQLRLGTDLRPEGAEPGE